MHTRRLLPLAVTALLAACAVPASEKRASEMQDRTTADRLPAAPAATTATLRAASDARPAPTQPQFLFIIRRAAAAPSAPLTATVSDNASPLTLTAHSLTADVRGFLATLTLNETFRADQTALDAAYTLPLDPDTLIEDAIIKTPDRELRLVVRQRDEAQAAYDAARRSGYVATLIDQSAGDHFTLHIGRLDAGKSLAATITCAQILPWNGHAFLFQTRSFPTPTTPGAIFINSPASVSSGGLWSAERIPPGNAATPRLLLYHAHLGTEDFAALVALPDPDPAAAATDFHLETTGLSPAPPATLHLTDTPILLIAKVTAPLHASATLNSLPLAALEAGDVDPKALAALWARAQAATDPTQSTPLGLRYGIVTPTTSLLGISLPTPATQP